MSVPTLAARGRRGAEVSELRAIFRRDLKDGTAKLSAILRDGVPDFLGSATAERLLLWAPRVGPRAAHSLLLGAHLGPMQEAKFITTRQRLLLADELQRIENLKRARSHRTTLGTRRTRSTT